MPRLRLRKLRSIRLLPTGSWKNYALPRVAVGSSPLQMVRGLAPSVSPMSTIKQPLFKMSSCRCENVATIHTFSRFVEIQPNLTLFSVQLFLFLFDFLNQAPKDPCGNTIVDERMVFAAGKLKLLDRILPKLKAQKHKVRGAMFGRSDV